MRDLSDSSDQEPKSYHTFDTSAGSNMTTGNKSLDTSLENETQVFLAGLKNFEEQMDNLESTHRQTMSHGRQLISQTDASKHLSPDNKRKKSTDKSLAPQKTNVPEQGRRSLTPTQKIPEQGRRSLAPTQKVPELSALSDITNLKSDSDQMLNGSYMKLPTMEQLISDKPSYNFPETNRQALITGLRSVEQQIQNLMSEREQAEQLSKDSAGMEATVESLTPQLANVPEQGRLGLPTTQNVPEMQDLSDSSDQILDISTGSYMNLPPRKDSHRQKSHKPVYSFDTTTLDLLRDFERQMGNLDSDRKQPVSRDRQIISQTDACEDLSSENIEEGATVERLTPQQANDLISSVSSSESKCTLLRKKIEELKLLVLNAATKKAKMKQKLEYRKSNEASALPQPSRATLDKITGLEREILQLSVIKNVSEERIKLLEQELVVEERRKAILLQKILKLINQFDSVDFNLENVFAFMKSRSKYLCAFPHNELLASALAETMTNSLFLNCNNLQDVFTQLQNQFSQLIWEHQNLTQEFNEANDIYLQQDIEMEIDYVVTQMEIKAMQMINIRKILAKNETKYEKMLKLEMGKSLCKSKSAFLADNLRTLKRAGVPMKLAEQTGTENVVGRSQQISEDMRKLQANLRQDDLSWV